VGTNEIRIENSVAFRGALVLHSLNNFMETRDVFSVALAYIKRRFEVQISSKLVAREEKPS
jgi:hypothetical protein